MGQGLVDAKRIDAITDSTDSGATTREAGAGSTDTITTIRETITILLC